MAEAACSDGLRNSSLQAAARVDRNHSERNAHRLFNHYGLSLRVKISELHVPGSSSCKDDVSIPYLKVSDYAKLLLDQYPQLLLGGNKIGVQSRTACRLFWDRFKTYHPEHVLFQNPPQDLEPEFTIPLLLHGDKGRTLQKSPVFVWSFESPWGMPDEMVRKCSYDIDKRKRQVHGNLSCTCGDRLRASRKRSHAEMTGCPIGCPERYAPTEAQRHNSKGHSYLSRFLICACTSKLYKRNEAALPAILKETAVELEQLFQHGLVTSCGVRMRFAVVGCKGDAEFHVEAASFERSYHRSGTVNEAMVCPWCEAGKPGLPFTDATDQPCWAASMGSSDPWAPGFNPPLNQIPFAGTFRAFLYKFDPFHVTKFGVYRDLVGSSVVRMCLMGLFDDASDSGQSVSIENRFERSFSSFQLWLLANKKSAAIKKFSKDNMNFKTYKSFAWINAKGSDVTLLLMWLDFVTGLFCGMHDSDVLRAMQQTIRGALDYIGIMHSHPLWLSRSCAQVQVHAGFTFLRGYLWLANCCMEQGVSGYRLRPKLHSFCHLLKETQDQLLRGSEYVLSSAAFLCEANEDFIGRVSRTSRRVAARTACYRTTQRYLAKMRALLDRLQLD